ncbi:MAG: 50S ribosomal protein L24 [Candidatus Neomarinimicrobiota bacterium]|nr:50S ribosomal protein L24 [Candidatus Neomarinimicrobiota bacterium]|tara:strand:+ start:825 stop:1133 length:309 start_codon:yes stop_codon:yes gene_type:complete
MFIKKGMTVRVINGNHKGLEGKILRVFPKNERVIVEGVNFVKKAIRPSQENPAGGMVEKEAALHVSNIMAIHGNVATRIGYKIMADGTKVRISKKTNNEIDA